MSSKSKPEVTKDNVTAPSIPQLPVIIQLEGSLVDVDKAKSYDGPSIQTTSNSVQTPPVFCVPPAVQPVVGNSGKNAIRNEGGGGGGGLGPPVAKSLLGADLIPKTASLAMPPPSSTTVKKARNVSPGMSMVKWMKLQESRIRPPTRKKITLSEISKHNTESDCWMVIRNCVYDVTEYIPYHPGGIPELMKGAGKDATALFNEVHRWVNFDSILRSCLQGYLQIEVGESFDEEETDADVQLSGSLVPVAAGNRKLVLPEAKFSQSDTDLIFHVDTKYDGELSDDNWCVSVLNRERLLLKVILKPPELWMAHCKLIQSLSDDFLSVRFQNSFKSAVITIQKPSIGKWKSLGSPLEGNNKLMDSRTSTTDGDDYSTGTIIEKESLTHNVILIGVQVASSSFIGVPVGFHLRLRIIGSEVEGPPARKYTPVIRSILEDNRDAVTVQDHDKNQKILYFIIKVYQDGKFTKELDKLDTNSQLELGVVAGRYDPSFFTNCDTLALIAGGSGVTPFVRIADFLRKRSATYPISRIILIFFNHIERDIIWKDQWTRLAEIWSEFHFFPVVSVPEQAWTGLRGRVDNVQLFESILQKTVTKSKEVQNSNKLGKFKAMLCGSSGFNDACVTMFGNQSVTESPVTEEDIFIF